MEKRVNIYEAKTHLSELINQVQETGVPYTICRNNKPVVDNVKLLGVHEIPVDVQVALASTQLPPIHRDPFDRIIIATATKHGMTILTKDRIIPTYPKVKAVWE